jgi:microcystin-dependent protein
MEGFIGEIRIFAGNFAPRAWAFCEGQLLPISQNTALFSILGTTYGGDGRTTFALPDLKGRVAVNSGGNSTGPGLPSFRLGQKGGTETNSLNVLQMPNHGHSASLTGTVKPAANAGSPNDSDDPSNSFYQTQSEDTYADAPATGEFAGALSNTLAFTTAPTGSSAPINNLQPFLSTYYIICLQGVYPSRS